MKEALASPGDLISVSNNSPLNVEVTALTLVTSFFAQYVTGADTTAATLTVADISGGVLNVVNMTGTLGAGATLTLPTVASLASRRSAAAPFSGQTAMLRVINSSSGNFAWTVTTATGWTLAGTMTVAQNTFRDFIITYTSPTAATLQSIGTGTTS